jgi:hypothetical protein
MSRFNKVVLISLLLICTGMMAGCTKKPGGSTAAGSGASKLDDARVAAENAEQKLGELRQERIKLEKELQAKQAEPQK